MKKTDAITDPLAPPNEHFSHIFRKFELSIENCIPAIVESYDRTQNLVTVHPAINLIMISGESESRPLMKIPCLNPCGSGIGINFPLSKGDTGWIIGCDRDASVFKDSLAVSNPNSIAIHKYHFGFFIPDKIKGFQINEEDDGALVIETLDSNTKISIKEGKVKIKSSSDVFVESPNTSIVSSNVKIESSVITVTSPTTNWTGNIMLSGSITITNGDVIADGVSLKNHIHIDSQRGNTSPPVV